MFKHHASKIFFAAGLFMVCFLFSVSNVALAQGTPTTTRATSTGAGSTAGSSATLSNPLGTNDLSVLIGRVIRALTGVVGALALLMFVVGGILWMTAAGNDAQLKTAQGMLTNSAIGLLIIFLAYTIISAFFNLFSA